MERLLRLFNKEERLVIGLMSGTSADGIDAALVKISGEGIHTKAELIHFENFSYDEKTRNDIFRLFNVEECRADFLCHMNFLLGELFAKAAMDLTAKAGYNMDQIDLIGSHGQTVYHIPVPIIDSGYEVRSTLQIGESAVIAERTGVVTVSDFRVRDVAAGGQGAPLVPYTEFLLYRDVGKSIGLQNIGGIANITILPRNCSVDDVYAFDNGPGNMVIDEVVKRVTGGAKRFDNNGEMALNGKIDIELLNFLMDNKYFKVEPPKTCGREYFGSKFTDELMEKAALSGICNADLVATVTAFTAKAISESIRDFVIPKCSMDKLVISGGGSYNSTLVDMIRNYLPCIEVITQEDMGLNSDAKEAVAFAVLANETINGNCNNVPGATGAKKKVIMGKISL